MGELDLNFAQQPPTLSPIHLEIMLKHSLIYAHEQGRFMPNLLSTVVSKRERE